MPEYGCPILVIAYGEEVRRALTASIDRLGASSLPFASFREAENHALQNLCCGILVDLTSIVKAKGEEKAIACSLTGFYPTLRVRAMGNVVIPMIMPGGTRQENNLETFLDHARDNFAPRRLRGCRRHELCVPVVIEPNNGEIRGVTLNMAWDGLFVVNFQAENFSPGQEITLHLPEFRLDVKVEVIWVQPWGQRRMPGLGVRFLEISEELARILAVLLRTPKEEDRDRMLAS